VTFHPKSTHLLPSTDFDIIIIGGGLAGLSLSCLLGQITGWNIACLDKDSPETQIKSDLRTTAISYGSAQILDQAGIWNTLEPLGCPIRDIEILDGDSPTLLQFLSSEVEDKSFGWILSNTDIRKTLMNKINSLKNMDHIAPANVRNFNVTEEKAEITLDNGKTLSAKLIIGADGRQSSVRDFMDVHVRGWNYHQSAIVCFIKHEHPHQNKAIEHFWPSGPFAILPMNDDEDGNHRSSLVFTEHDRSRNSLMNLSDKDFLSEVQSRFPEFYGHVEIIDNKRMKFPLSLTHAADYIAPRMVLVADAAHGIHPIAGQGLNLGFRDIGELANLLKNAYEDSTDPATPELLETYQRRRRPDNMAMVAVTDGLVRLFSNDIPPVRLLRRYGLKTVSRLGIAKKFFMRRAMGE